MKLGMAIWLCFRRFHRSLEIVECETSWTMDAGGHHRRRLGHKTLAEAERYTPTRPTRSASQRLQCTSSRVKKHEQVSQTPATRAWENAKNQKEIRIIKESWRSLGDSNPCFRRERVRFANPRELICS